MAALIEVTGGRARRESESQPQQGWEVSGVVVRARFENAKDPQIPEWAGRAIEKAGGDPQKAKIIACVPVENAKKWDLNKEIGQAMEDSLIERGMLEKNISIRIEAMDFWMLSTFVNAENWKAVQQRLAYATDEDGTGLVASKKIPDGSWQALKDSDTPKDFKNALSSLGDALVFFPGMGDDATVTWLYDEMRKATVQKEQERLGVKETPKEEKIEPLPPKPKKQRISPIAPPMPQMQPPERPPPVSWLDASVNYRGGLPISSWPPGSIFNPPLSSAGGFDPSLVSKIYTLNDLLGIHTPLQSLEQLKKDQKAFETGQIGTLFNDTYFDSLRALPTSYASRVMKELFEVGAQIKIGQLEEKEKLYFFSSIPMVPMRGTLPLMNGVAFSLYHCNMVGAAWTKDWMLKNWDKAELTAQSDIRLGMIYSDRSLSGSPAPKSYQPAGLGLKLMDSYKTADVLPDLIPLVLLDARLIYERELSNKVSVSGTLAITASDASLLVSRGWPSALFEGEASLKKILDTSFAALNGGVRFGWNVPAMRFEEISAYLSFKPKNGNLPSLSIGASETWPLKGSVTNVMAKLEENFKISQASSIGLSVEAGATLYPRTSDLFGPERATKLEFGISWRGILPAAEQGGE
jgi:hypothetical protein